jgi:hypothetical protein
VWNSSVFIKYRCLRNSPLELLILNRVAEMWMEDGEQTFGELHVEDGFCALVGGGGGGDHCGEGVPVRHGASCQVT